MMRNIADRTETAMGMSRMFLRFCISWVVLCVCRMGKFGAKILESCGNVGIFIEAFYLFTHLVFMKLIVKNFGPIKSGEIDLSKRFYVFVGYNNSGKTYMAQLLWSIFNFENIEDFLKESSHTFAKYIPPLTSNQFVITPPFVAALLESYTKYINEKLIPSLFNLPSKHFLFNRLLCQLVPDDEDVFQSPWSNTVGFGNKIIYMDKEGNDDVLKLTGEILDDLTIPICGFVMTLALKTTLNTTYLPANRTFYPTFYEYIYSAEKEKRERMSQRVQEASEIIQKHPEEAQKLIKEISTSFKSNYTLAVNALIDNIFELNTDTQTSRFASLYKDLLEELKQLLGGDIKMKRREGLAPIEFLLEMKKGQELEMYLASSSVNQLTVLYLYLKYWVKRTGNFLIIDEPEENLHLKNQLALTDILIQFANNNDNRVLIATHSPTLVEHINNYIYLDTLKNKLGKDVAEIIEEEGLDIRSDISLSKDDVGVYFFDGRRIIDYKDDVNEGIYFRDFIRHQEQVRRAGKVLTDYIYQEQEEMI